LFENWIGHLVERLVRLDRFVKEVATASPLGEDCTPRLAETFLRRLDDLAERLAEGARFYRTLTEEKELQAYSLDLYTRLRQIATEFHGTHGDLALLPSTWAPRELYSFVGHVIADRQAAPPLLETLDFGKKVSPWTIVLDDDYDFSHLILADPLETALDAVDESEIFRLPKAEKDNPLAWSVLGHEVAHAVAIRCGLIDEALELVKSANASHQRTWEDWLPEIAADLIATDLLGPAYAMSFMASATFMVPNTLRWPEESHPPPTARVEYIRARLRQSDLSHLPAARDPLQMQYENEYDLRTVLDNQDHKEREALHHRVAVNGAGIGNDSAYPEEDEVRAMALRLTKLPSYPTTLSVRKSSYEKSIELSKALAKGIPIASSRIREPFGKFPSEKSIRDDFSEACDHLRERPHTAAEIMMAAMIRRMSGVDPSTRKTISAELIDHFLSNAHNIRPLDQCAQEISRFDELVSKSIEDLAVISFFQEGRSESRS
jgi:hypothetical protein